VDAARRGLDEAQSLQSRDPSNRLWQEIGVKAANTAAEAKMMTGDWAGAQHANSLALTNARKLVAVDQTVPEWRTDCLLPARWMEIAIRVAAGQRAAASGLIATFRQDFRWNDATRSADERFAWVMVETLDGIVRRASGDPVSANASFQRAVLYLPKSNGLMDARLVGAARYLQKTTRVTGLPASAPAMAGRVQYNVGALLSSSGG
jgi:hypothetical protein